MADPKTADDIIPLVAGLGAHERIRLIRLIVEQSDVDDGAVYGVAPPQPNEFSSDEEPLAWEAAGWEKFD